MNMLKQWIFGKPSDKTDAVGGQSLIVAAFDFGTTYSGYAFSFKHSPNEIKTNKSWNAMSGNLISLKTPTSVLLNEDGEFDSFGFDAEDKYVSLAADGKHHGWRLFRRFKMVLHNQKRISRSATVDDLEGKPFAARPIFTMVIRYLQKHLLDALNLSHIGTLETDITYVITVPAIWGIAAKQFMREAAIEAGINCNRLKLALEPEAAAVFCEALGHTLVGQKFMVVDIGGGTADISVHERNVDGSLKNIHTPSGGTWGGIYVDANFTQFMVEIFGTRALTALQADDMYDYFDMIRDFEVKKRNSQTDITFRIPLVLKENAEEHFHQSLSDRLSSLMFGEKVFMRGKDKLGIHPSIMQSFFTDQISAIVNHISSVLKEERMKNVGLIILVGGFAESPYVQQRIQTELQAVRLIVPEETGLAVLKGAVMFGHKPNIISSRVMDYTYGVEIFYYDFEEKYPMEKKILMNGQWMVKDVFMVFVRVNEDVPFDNKVTHTLCPNENPDYVAIFRTENNDPMFTTDPGCELVGRLAIDFENDIPLEEQKIEVTLMFGDTDLRVLCKHVNTGKVNTLTLDIAN
ncbi:heat shock 70 kDa protein 12A-like isoform X3 [Dreissena polymorpha]|uniref:heat shock 70 kDa protein 12A-like isoform X3 n=1 Tax=Dreissena polymorpha TaxID=45954 RepID=UPI002264C652|nr:heat shock 70 kDa protein 12A-like isoform X3 [Dreissena polymorpha]